MLTLTAPAKINLTLEVLGKRPDGFHEIKSIVQTIGLCDIIKFQESADIEFCCDFPGWDAGKSLILRAAALLKDATGCNRGAMITLDKRIPLSSGLGGDSSNAAAALRGLNKLWGLGLPRDELAVLSAQLGSDVPLFFYSGAVLLEGRGEKVTPLKESSEMWVVLLVPQLPVMSDKTVRLYSAITPEHCTKGEPTERLLSQLGKGGEIETLPLFNVFDNVVFDCFVGLADYRERFIKAGAKDVHAAGSGPVLFTATPDIQEAEGIYHALKSQGVTAFLTNTLGRWIMDVEI